jgi:hypothetical protein
MAPGISGPWINPGLRRRLALNLLAFSGRSSFTIRFLEGKTRESPIPFYEYEPTRAGNKK